MKDNVHTEPISELQELAASYLAGDLDEDALNRARDREEHDRAFRREVALQRECLESLKEWIAEEPPGLDEAQKLPIPSLIAAPTATVRAMKSGWAEYQPLPQLFAAALLICALLVALLSSISPGGHSLHESDSAFVHSNDSAMLLGLSREVLSAMKPNTEICIESETEIKLEQGSVWLWVQPGGKGYKVQTQFGTVQVLGTSYGVTIYEDSMTVEVAEGKVKVVGHGSDVVIEGGERVIVGQDAIGNIGGRAAGRELPNWVRQLEQNPPAASYLPSLGTERP